MMYDSRTVRGSLAAAAAAAALKGVEDSTSAPGVGARKLALRDLRSGADMER